MVIKRLGRQLRREIAANKGRAALLGVGSLAALYFWAPLLAGWLSSEKSEPPPAVARAIQPDAPAATVPAIAAGQPGEPAWSELVPWMLDDQRMQSATLPQGVDPFRELTLPMATDKQIAADKAADGASDNVTPEALGMELTSTLIGPQRGVIQISGKTYVIQLDRDGTASTATTAMEQIDVKTESGQYRFDVVTVRPGLVILQDGDRRIELKVQRSSLAENESIHFYSENN